MATTLLYIIFITISTINIAHFGIYLIGANIYDIGYFKRLAISKRNRKSYKPLVSILIPAHNEELSIIRSIESVRNSTYKNREIIVIDDASKDATSKLVRAYIKKNPKSGVTLMRKHKNVGKAGALNHALKRKVKGELIMTLDADSILHKDSLRNAVRYFEDPKIVGVAANVRVQDSYSILGLLQKFEYMVAYRSKKFFSITNSEIIIGGVASTYRAAVMKKVGFYDDDTMTEDIALSMKIVAEGNRQTRVVYGVDVLAMTEGVLTLGSLLKQRYRWKMGNLQSIIRHRNLVWNADKKYSKMLTWYRMPMAFLGEVLLLLEPLAFVYIIFLCLQMTSLSVVIGAYIFISLYLILNVMQDEHLSFFKKLKMTLYVPIMYFIMYIMNVVQFYAVTRCIINYKQALMKVKKKSTWQSPERTGQTQVTFS